MKRVLIVAYFFPPLGGGGCQRTLKLVRYLEPNGWRSTVVTTRDRDYWILDPSLEREIPAETEVLRVGGLTGGKVLQTLSRAGVPVQEKQGRRRAGPLQALRSLQRWTILPDAYRSWAQAAERAASERIDRGGVDAIWTTSSPESAHLAGLALQKRHRLPWVADFRDPWVGRVTYRPPTAWHDARHRAMERRVVTSADRVTLVSEAMVALYRARYPAIDPERFVMLPNGFDPDDWRRADLEGEASPQAPSRRFVLLHAGQLAHRPTVRTLLEAARLLLERDPSAREDLRVRFTGGNEEIGPRERERYGLGETLEFAPSEPHIDSLVSMRRAGALALLGHGGSADSLLYTGKIYEYLTSGRPVLAILDEGPAAELVRSSGGGIVVRPGDVPGTLNVLREWLAAFRAGKDLAVQVSPTQNTAWERPKLAAQAARILSEIAPSKPS
ncbi:MAG TPA: glycosyltransferase [Candidatus Saccharimonadales bacterium]|nr:glycosyltransferase [Candidatus Saccharimonadales bacterium]